MALARGGYILLDIAFQLLPVRSLPLQPLPQRLLLFRFEPFSQLLEIRVPISSVATDRSCAFFEAFIAIPSRDRFNKLRRPFQKLTVFIQIQSVLFIEIFAVHTPMLPITLEEPVVFRPFEKRSKRSHGFQHL